MALKITELELGIRDNASQAARGIDRLTRSLTKLKAASANSDIGKIAEQLVEIQHPSGNGNGIGRVGDQIADIAPKAKKSASALGNLWSSIKRIAMYRAIRTAMKIVTQSISEGIQNLYQYSLIAGTEFAPAMDKLATSALYLKNSLGAMISPIIEFLTPYVDFLVDKFVDLLNIINQVFSALAGKSTYTKAIKQTTKFAEATDSASKAMKKMIFGFDELNILSDPNSGAAKEMKDYATMFETVAIDNPLAKFVLKIGGFDVENLTGLSGYDVSSSILGVMLGTAGAVIGAVAGGGGGGALIGFTIGAVLAALINKATFKEGEASSEGMFQTLPDALPSVFEFETEGEALKGRVWSYLDMPLGSATFKKGNGFLGSEMMDNLTKVLTTATFSAIGFKVGGFVGHPLAGAFIGALIGLSMGMDITSADFKEGKKGLKQLMESSLISTVAALGGLALGFVLTGSLAGGLMGATLAISLTMLLKNIDWDKNGKDFWSGKWFDDFSQDWGAVSPTAPKGLTSVLEFTDEDLWGGDVPRSVFHRASGGSVPRGAMFIAGEAGAEIVSNIGGGTQVSNIDQLSAANNNVVEAVYSIGNAIVGAINSQDYGTYIDGEKLTRTINSKMKALNHYNGESLVQGAY